MEENVRAGQLIHHDEWGNEYVLDEMGNHMPPMQAAPLPKKNASDWTEYDTSQGHCGLCGRLTCRGSCFK